MANPKKRRKIIIFTVIALVLVGGTLAAVFQKREVVITVQTDKVARRSLTELVVANGKIQPVVQVVISPEVAGEITALPVKEGDRVKKGDLLVQIKPDNYQASRNSAEAIYKSALGSATLAQASRVLRSFMGVSLGNGCKKWVRVRRNAPHRVNARHGYRTCGTGACAPALLRQQRACCSLA